MAGSSSGGATCGTCAICLGEVLPSEEAFLDTCFHHFHLQCIQRWAAVQLAHPPAQSTALACPLCRRPFASAIFDCEGGAYRREYFAQGLENGSSAGGRGRASGRITPTAGGGSGSLELTAQHRRRRAVYSLPLPAEEQERRRERVAASLGRQHAQRAQQAQRADVEQFVERELQALMLQPDVALVAQHVVATLRNAAAAAAGPGRRTGAAGAGMRSTGGLGAAAGGCQRAVPLRQPGAMAAAATRAGPAAAAAVTGASGSGSGMGGSSDTPAVPDLVARLQAAAAPFVFEHAERFAWEVAAFAAAGSATVAAYDRLTLQLDAAAAARAGAEARQQLLQQQQQQHMGQSRPSAWHNRSHGYSSRSSSGDEGSGEGGPRHQGAAEPQRSDSEGYLDLLLQQGSWRRQGAPASQPCQQQQGGEGSAAPQGLRLQQGQQGQRGQDDELSSGGAARGRQKHGRGQSRRHRSTSYGSSGSGGSGGSASKSRAAPQSSPPRRHKRHCKQKRRHKRKSSSRARGRQRGRSSDRGSSSSRSSSSNRSSGRVVCIDRGRSRSRTSRGRRAGSSIGAAAGGGSRSRSASSTERQQPVAELAALRQQALLAHQRHVHEGAGQQGGMG